MLTVGLFIGLAVEWIAVHIVHRWRYTPDMPRLLGKINNALSTQPAPHAQAPDGPIASTGARHPAEARFVAGVRPGPLAAAVRELVALFYYWLQDWI